MPDLKIITEFGAFGIIALLLWLSWDKDKRFIKTINNHLEHEMESRDANTAALQKMSDALESLKDVVRMRV